AGGAWAFYTVLGDRFEPALAVKTAAVQVMTVGQANAVLTATGYLESRQQAAVGAKAPGRVASLLAEEGDRVEQGALLAVLEHDDLKAALASRKVEILRAQADLAEAQNTLAQRERDYGRQQALRGKGAGTEAELEEAQTAFEAAKARVDSLGAAVQAAEAFVREGEEAIRNMHIYAPFAGTIISKDAELGETIMPGGMGLASGRGSVVTLADLSALEVGTDVKEDFLGQVRAGQPADVVVDAVPGRRYRGRVRQIIPMGDRSRGVVQVKVQVMDPDERLFPELSATVHFLPETDGKSAGDARPATFVPAGAVVTHQGKQLVWRVENERAGAVAVQVLGKEKDGLIQVEPGSGGPTLSGGDVLIVEPPANITENARVRTSS
ncbi:MAG: efflux RND transporter periplasmic adaptor subunit, partial [Pirellulales bacterium]